MLDHLHMVSTELLRPPNVILPVWYVTDYASRGTTQHDVALTSMQRDDVVMTSVRHVPGRQPVGKELFNRFTVRVFIRPFEKRSYYVIPPGVRPSVRPSVCKLFRFRVTPPTVYVRLSWNLVYMKAMRWFNAYYLEVMVQRFLAELQPFN